MSASGPIVCVNCYKTKANWYGPCKCVQALCDAKNARIAELEDVLRHAKEAEGKGGGTMSDEQTAKRIVEDAMNAACETSMEAAIVKALQDAYADGYTNGHTVGINHEANREVLRMCHEARMCNGIVDYSDQNATGVVRRVLGTLPITADGCVAEYGNSYWYWDTINTINQPTKYGWTERVLVSCDPFDAEYSWTTDPSLCYSTREAAQAAKEAK